VALPPLSPQGRGNHLLQYIPSPLRDEPPPRCPCRWHFLPLEGGGQVGVKINKLNNITLTLHPLPSRERESFATYLPLTCPLPPWGEES